MLSNIVDYDPKYYISAEFGNIPTALNAPCLGTFSNSSITYRVIPYGFNVVGTCGNCGGPVLSPQSVSGNYQPEDFCADCGKKAKKIVQPFFGRIREME